jgi:hypothetical protein
VLFCALLCSVPCACCSATVSAVLSRASRTGSHSLRHLRGASAEREELLQYLTSAEFRTRPLSYALLAYVADGAAGPARMLMGSHDRVQRVDATRDSAGSIRISSGVDVVGEDEGISVMDRTTGIVLREAVPSYIKVAMKLMYSSVGKHAVQTGAVVRLLQHMSAKQGVVMDNPQSAKQIPVRAVTRASPCSWRGSCCFVGMGVVVGASLLPRVIPVASRGVPRAHGDISS